ncbi:hypothetical protein PVAP13_5KG282807 [Panicum virgatum]|uniref:Uncharacterized protein n=1 Tax=Panicum virgatum TaxID=38727 RepID=A0A8T0SHS2_PANVG|nr:hypothetical protein PVAP13_5KG282807 [Panicum virgatum]
MFRSAYTATIPPLVLFPSHSSTTASASTGGGARGGCSLTYPAMARVRSNPDNLSYLVFEKLQARRMQGHMHAWIFIRFLLFLEKVLSSFVHMCMWKYLGVIICCINIACYYI